MEASLQCAGAPAGQSLPDERNRDSRVSVEMSRWARSARVRQLSRKGIRIRVNRLELLFLSFVVLGFAG
ncbi:hypothetical protein TNCV_227281 [Trichonephila clavipes]|nr:hypothetical protein TNCV_227281 [Trichonephila clavipes]